MDKIRNEETKTKVLLVIENPELQSYVSLILIGEGHIIQAYSSQADLLDNMNKESFDLIISEFSSPGIDGLEICRILRETFLLRHTPMIMILPDDDPITKAKVIYGGADDYIEKSSMSEDLLLKVKTALWRVYRYQDVHPVSKLPGVSTAMKEIKSKIESKELFTVACTDLSKFRIFNDHYGFKKGDEIVVHTASIIRDAMLEFGSAYDFLAHFGGDDFVFITLPESLDSICRRIIEVFDSTILSFYDEADRNKKSISIKNRQGMLSQYPIMKISIGVTSNKIYTLSSAAQTFQIITELKDFAKKIEKSAYVKERRKHYPFY